MDSEEIQWTLNADGTSSYKDWVLLVNFPEPGSLEKKYFLYGPVCTEIKTEGGVYTALDIAVEIIRANA